MLSLHDSFIRATALFKQTDQKSRFLARQLLILNSPLSKLVELYLFDNEGRQQKLDKFPMMRPIYDGIPKKLLLKCSRKTLKSTLISNMIVLNLLRYNFYRMMYVAPNEQATKRFSHDYLAQRLSSPPLKHVISKVFPNDVYVKGIKDTNSNIILTYASDDPDRTRGPATMQNIYDEVQGMNLDIIPIINETMAISDIQREIYAGTPMTTDNTINSLWKTANQIEWLMRCGHCRHWNALTEDNEPMKMIRPHGLSCSKCGNKLDSSVGQWVDFNPGKHELQGFHLAQPILPHYNGHPDRWEKVYLKCYGERAGSILQIYNEVFGLPFDIGSKPITESELKRLCVLKEMKGMFQRHAHRYCYIVMGVDWGVNPISSRTVCTVGGFRSDGVLEIFFIKIYKNTNYEQQIRELADIATGFQPNILLADSGPDPIRGKMLGNLYDPTRTQLVAYRESTLPQYYDNPTGALDWSQGRWCLNRSESMGFTMDMLKKGMILLPRWEDCSEACNDILAIFTEVQEENLKSRVMYRHRDPDDFFHTLNYITCAANLWAGNSFFNAHNITGNGSILV